jgi:hypothetical protein
MIEDYLISGAYKVTKAVKDAYNGVPASSPLALVGTAPTEQFKFRITVASVTNHADCSGSITVGTETLTFSISGQKKVTSVLNSSWPSVTYSGLDCSILIECLDSGGAEIKEETLVAIDTRIERYDSGFYDSSGHWTKTDTMILSNTSMNIGDTVRKSSSNYTIRKAEDNPDLGGESDFYTYLAN